MLSVRRMISSGEPRHVVFTYKMAVSDFREREILTNVLRKFRDLPCLWDRNNVNYSNKVRRSEANNQLLTLYKLYDPKANILELKRRLENMRTTYRRIRVKLLEARAQGKDFKPTLWYYNELKFLDSSITAQFSDYEQIEAADENDENDDEMEEVDYLKSDSRSNSPPPPKERRSNYVFLTEEDTGSVNRADLSTIMEQKFTKNNLEPSSSSANCFGKTVASQLDELQPLQRYVAEKLISEIIFYARLDKLCPETSIQLKNE